MKNFWLKMVFLKYLQINVLAFYAVLCLSRDLLGRDFTRDY